VAEYVYDGIGKMVMKSFPTPQVRLTPGRDRFGRVVDQHWSTAAGAARDRFRYAYDSAGNRVWREVMDNAAFGGTYYSEHYTYDGLDRLTDTKRGQLTGPTAGSPPYTAIAGTPSRQETFGLSQLGNWKNYDVLTNGSATLSQTRAHNTANEITAITNTTGAAWTAPTYDNAGNMTTGVGGKNYIYSYDAWNRLVKVTDGAAGGGATTVVEYYYDGLGRQISKLVPVGGGSSNWNRTDYYHNDNWQVLEERVGLVANATTPATTPHIQWVWDTQYIDTPVCRFRDTAGNGTWSETLYYTTDANANVTALVDTAGNVAERTTYDTYGKPTFYAGSSFATASAASGYNNEVLFAGYHYDALLNIYRVRHRIYDPITGRWGQRDPEGDIDGPNLYQYVRSNPMRFVDPQGLWGEDIHKTLTAILAAKAGIACWDDVAKGVNKPDEDERRPGAWGVWDAVWDREKWGVMSEWHFPADEDGTVTPNSEVAKAKVQQGVDDCDFTRFTEGLHVLQDSWSHQGTPGAGKVGHGRGAKQMIEYKHGQNIPTGRKYWEVFYGLEAAIDGSADDVTLWPADARTAGKETYEWLLEFKKKCPCACPGPGGKGTMKTSKGEAAELRGVNMFLDQRFPGRNIKTGDIVGAPRN